MSGCSTGQSGDSNTWRRGWQRLVARSWSTSRDRSARRKAPQESYVLGGSTLAGISPPKARRLVDRKFGRDRQGQRDAVATRVGNVFSPKRLSGLHMAFESRPAPPARKRRSGTNRYPLSGTKASRRAAGERAVANVAAANAAIAPERRKRSRRRTRRARGALSSPHRAKTARPAMPLLKALLTGGKIRCDLGKKMSRNEAPPKAIEP